MQRRSLRQKRPLSTAQAWACNLVELFGDPGIRRWADCRVQVGVVLQHADAMSQQRLCASSSAPFRYQHLLSHWQTGRRLILWAKQQARRNRADHAEVRRNCFFLSAPQAARPYRLGQTVAHQVTKRLGDSRNNGFSYAAVGIPGPASPAWSRVPPRVGESIRRNSLAVA